MGEIENSLVSVIMPVYNAEFTLNEAIDSILNQSYYNIELLIGFDGCTDNSVRIAKNYIDQRIKLFIFDENRGNNYTRNILINNANGKYLCYADADDISLPNRIEQELAFLIANPNIFGVFSSLEEFGARKRILYASPNLSDYIAASTYFKNRIYQPSMMLRLDIFKKAGLSYDIELENAGDYDLWLKAINLQLPFASINKPLVKYRISSSQISTLKKEDRINKIKKITLQKTEFLKISGFTKEDLHMVVDYLMGTKKVLSSTEYRKISKYLKGLKQALIKELQLDKRQVSAVFFFYSMKLFIKQKILIK
jgi:glycosyltransferase involved in cell wall biosynthesis